MIRHAMIAAGLALAVAGCATKTDPRAAVSAAQKTLTAAGTVALAYMRLPTCPAQALCAAPNVKNQIKVAFDAAADALNAAQATADAGGSPDMTAATAALQALQGLLAGLPKP